MTICDRWHCLPSAAYEESADILRLLQIEALGRPERDERNEDGGGEASGW